MVIRGEVGYSDGGSLTVERSRAEPNPTAGASPGAKPRLTEGQIRAAGILEESITDGPGLRLVVFAQGCPHRCRGCHNPATHSYDGGTLIGIDSIVDQARANPLLNGVTLSGGEPFEQAQEFAVLAGRVKELGLNVMTYTGYTFETILAGSMDHTGWRDLLERTDVLVDGPFMLERRSLGLRFRGSDNQRIIDVKHSLQRQETVLMYGDF